MEDFEAWVQARRAGLARSAYLLTGDRHLAEDLVQDTLVRVADHWRRVTRSGTPDAYARQVMHHLAIDRWRRRRARPVESLRTPPPEPAGALVLGGAALGLRRRLSASAAPGSA